ncbi:MAG: Choline-sulfatase [Planctomycetota bacterium]|jgi:N-sulfoglucosamine sulfohydrolase
MNTTCRTAVALAAAGALAAADGRPDILLVTTDDHGPHLGCLGTPGLRTPTFDALAAGGALFRRHGCVMPTCSPARATILTGRSPTVHGMLFNAAEWFGPQPPADWPRGWVQLDRTLALPPQVPTMVELLRDRGYVTAITHKFHLASHARYPFDEWLPDASTASLQRIYARAATRPVMVMVNLRAPHRPYQHHRNPGPAIDPGRTEPPAYLPDTPALRADWSGYLGAVQAADAQLGALRDAVAAVGRSASSVWIVTGDNGMPFHRAKMSAYPAGLAVPLIISGPGVAAGTRVDAGTSHLDILPTVLDWAGIEAPAALEGTSLRAWAAGIAPDRDRAMTGMIHYGGNEAPPNAGTRAQQSRTIVIERRWCLIRRWHQDRPRRIPDDLKDPIAWRNEAYRATVDAREAWPLPYRLLREEEGIGSAPEELYDLDADPWCTVNLAGSATAQPIMARARAAMTVWQESAADPLAGAPLEAPPSSGGGGGGGCGPGSGLGAIVTFIATGAMALLGRIRRRRA